MNPEIFIERPDGFNKNDELRHVISDAIEAEDFDFLVQVAESQSCLRPFEIVEFINSRRIEAEEDVEKAQKWGRGLGLLIMSLEEKDFPPAEQGVIDRIAAFYGEEGEYEYVYGIEFEDDEDDQSEQFIDNEVVVRYKGSDIYQNVEYWDGEEFVTLINDEEVDRVEELQNDPAFIKAEGLVAGRVTGEKDPLGARHEINNSDLDEESKTILHKLLDPYVSDMAVQILKDELKKTKNPEHATSFVKRFASCEEAEAYMRSVLDQYIYKIAERFLSSDYIDMYSNRAKRVILEYGSTQERQDAMLKHLGLE